MKKLSIIFLIIAGFLKAQNSTVPPGISYQGVARNAGGTVLANTTIAVKFEVVDIPSAAVVYSETYTGGTGLTTNNVGIFTAVIGSQNPPLFQAINWASGKHKIDIYIDTNNGTSFNFLGSQGFQTVPYAFHSADGLLWKGRSVLAPTTAIKGSVYRDPIGGATYYLNNSGVWDTLAFTAGSGSLPNGTMNQTLYHNGTNWATTSNVSVDGGNKLVVGKSFADASAVVDIADSLHGMLIPRMSFQKRTSIASPANGLLVFQINDNIFPLSPKGFYYYDAPNTAWAWIPPYNNYTSPWLRNIFGGNNNVYLADNSDNVAIGTPTVMSANEKLHVHNITGDAYIQLSTSSGSNNVGLVFGEAGNISKGVLAFDNFSNGLTYRLFGQRLLYLEGASKAMHIGKFPLGISSNAPLSVYDSVPGGGRPILRVINATGNVVDPSAIYLGSGAANGINISYRGSPVNKISFEAPGFGQSYHSFDVNGRIYPGNDGATGKAFIQGGPATSDDISINASASGNIVNVGYTKFGSPASQYPAIEVLEFNGTMPSTAGGNTTINLSSYVTTPDQIVSVQFFVKASTRTVPPSFTMFSNYEYHYEISPSTPNIFVWAASGNSNLILSQPFRVLITIKK